MKTSTVEVLCDECGKPVPVMSETPLFVTIKGVGKHKKADFCNVNCLKEWINYSLDLYL